MIKRGFLVLLLVGFGALANGQTLLEVQTVAAASLQLNPGVSLPSGSLRAVGEGANKLIARVPGFQAYEGWEVYTATGVLANLQPAFVQQLTTSFAAAGYFPAGQQEEVRDGETHTRYTFANDEGQETLLYVIRTPQELVWLVAKAR